MSSVGFGFASIYGTKWLSQTWLGGFGGAAASVVGFALIGWVILIIGWFAALFLAEIMRQWK